MRKKLGLLVASIALCGTLAAAAFLQGQPPWQAWECPDDDELVLIDGAGTAGNIELKLSSQGDQSCNYKVITDTGTTRSSGALPEPPNTVVVGYQVGDDVILEDPDDGDSSKPKGSKRPA